MNINFDKLFGDEDNTSPGSIGGKIKRIRELRGWTQKDLGIKCGFPENSADVRIRQYESGKKIPRDTVLKTIAEVLEIDKLALYDANLIPYNRLYQALFDIEDFHGLHPVKKPDGMYLEFNGETYLGIRTYKHDFDSFLEKWYEMYQRSLPNESDTEKDIENKKKEYTLWRYAYPMNSAKETSEQLNNLRKMRRLQAEMDELNAKMQSKSEFERIDSIISEELYNAKSDYLGMDSISAFIKQIVLLARLGISIDHYSPENTTEIDYDHIHIISLKTLEITKENEYLKDIAQLFCEIEFLQKKGINISRHITSNNKELFLSFKVVASQYEYFKALDLCWDNIISIKGSIIKGFEDGDFFKVHYDAIQKTIKENDIKI